MLFDESFFLAISIVLFGLLSFKKLKSLLNNILLTRVRAIENKFKELESIRVEAENLLHEYKKLKKESKSKSQEILKNAELEINHLKEAAAQELSFKLNLKTENSQYKIKTLENKALMDLRIRALNLAIFASISILKSKQVEFSQEIISQSLEEISNF